MDKETKENQGQRKQDDIDSNSYQTALEKRIGIGKGKHYGEREHHR